MLEAGMLDRLLERVERPSRYLGTELNSVHKDPADVDLRLALVFPDLYDLGLGNLGILILYTILNRVPWIWAERAYAPAPDMEAELRGAGLPLFALESGDPLSSMDGIGFTLQSELTYTNILNVLDLAGLPLRSRQRTDGHPLIFAGGPTVFNPEPLAPFMDFFVVGDGEEVIMEIAALLRQAKGATKARKLSALAEVEGVYVPIDPGHHSTGRVRRRIVGDLNKVAFPTDMVVPFTPQVHDRLGIEVLRGCTRGCRFCQAGMTSRPVRERETPQLEGLMKRGLASTGYEEVSLVSLSTCDHSQAALMVARMGSLARATRTSLSLPSLRLDSFSMELARHVAGMRRSGLTFAPETGSPRLRSLINKWFSDEDFISLTTRAYSEGWDRLKLYFMIGLPGEGDEDVLAIADLALRVLSGGRSYNRRARLNLGISNFVPKPGTPLQWAAQESPRELRRRHGLVARRLARHHAIKINRHDSEGSWLEGIIGRSDSGIADCIERAFKSGARFDAWSEFRRMDLWQAAIERSGVEPGALLRARDPGESLPWDHIDTRVSAEWLLSEWKRANDLSHHSDCRISGCHDCGVRSEFPQLCAQMLKRSRSSAAPPRAPGMASLVPVEQQGDLGSRFLSVARSHEDSAPRQRVLLRFHRLGRARLLSHLETMTMWIRLLRRAGIPLAYSMGFHAHPKVAFSTALPVGEETLGDYIDLSLEHPMEVPGLLQAVRARLLAGFHVPGAVEIPMGTRALMALIQGMEYQVFLSSPPPDLGRRLCEAGSAGSWPYLRRSGKKRKMVDLKPGVFRLQLEEHRDPPVLHLEVRRENGMIPRPRDILDFLELDKHDCLVRKLDCLVARGDTFESLSTLFGLSS